MSLTIISQVLADYDTSAIRLVDFVNKRTTNPLTKACPHIPIIVFLHESNEREAMEHLRGAGGVTKIVRQPIQTKELLYTIIDVLSTQKKVEDTFKALTRKKIISSKYPYLPIFDAVNTEEVVADADGHKATRRPTRINEVGSVEPSVMSSHTGVHHHHETKVEELEDATECSSLLPDYVKRIRAESPELNSPYRQSRVRADTEEIDAEEERQNAEAAEREAWRARQNAKFAQQDDNMSIESSVHMDRPGDILTNESNHFVDGK